MVIAKCRKEAEMECLTNGPVSVQQEEQAVEFCCTTLYLQSATKYVLLEIS